MAKWKDIKGYNGKYKISDNGKVRNSKNNNILKGSINNRGYISVSLYNNITKKTKCFKVHRLVAQEFIPNYQNYKEVNHIDGNKLNNNVNNLEWCNRKENMVHAAKNNLVKNGKEHSIIQLDMNLHYINIYQSAKIAGQKLNIPPQSILKCCHNKIHKTHNFIFLFVEDFNNCKYMKKRGLKL